MKSGAGVDHTSEAKRSRRSNKPPRLFSVSASTRQPQPHVSRILHEIPILQAGAAVLQYCFLDWDVAGRGTSNSLKFVL